MNINHKINIKNCFTLFQVETGGELSISGISSIWTLDVIPISVLSYVDKVTLSSSSS